MKSFILLLKLFSLFFLSLSFQKNISAQTTVVIVGDFQSEAGCSSNWMPDCNATRLIQTSPGIWEGTINIPGGIWEYKVAHNNLLIENYGQFGLLNGDNIVLGLVAQSVIHFTYSSVTHLISHNTLSTGVNLAGDFQTEIGCPEDWMPDCDASSLKYTDDNFMYGIFSIPPGNWEYKITYNNSWAENYGLNGELNGENISLTVVEDKRIMFRYDPFLHIVTTNPVDHYVVVVGDFQSELGCPDDWMPDCYLTALSFDEIHNLWKGDVYIPPGNWQFKIALDGSWSENYGEGGIPGGPNMPLNLSAPGKVSFIYNPVTHLVQYETKPVTVVIPGSFQTELGCASDWDPACDNTRLTYDEVKQVWTGTVDLPAGNWEYKVALNNSWSENYGDGGAVGGENIHLMLPTPANITFNYDPYSHKVNLVYNTTGLCVTSFYDINADGVKEDFYNEFDLMDGVAFTLSGKGTQYTGGDGKTCFAGLPPGVYTIKETVPPGYLPTTLDSQIIDLTQPQTIDFGIVCLGGAGAENIAFWMSKKGMMFFDSLQDWVKDYTLSVLRYLNLRNSDGSDFEPASYEQLRVWLQKANSKNMAYKLSAQMAVLHLNTVTKQNVVLTGMIYSPGFKYEDIEKNFIDVNSLIIYTNEVLQLNSYEDDSNRVYQQYLYDLMVQANNDLIFVQLQPCNDNVPITCRPDTTIYAGNDCFAIADGVGPLGADSLYQFRVSGATTLGGSGSANGQLLKPGINYITYQLASDTTATCTFAVTVLDTIKPTIRCVRQTVCGSGSGNYVVPKLILNETCGLQSITYTIKGATNRTGNGVDASGHFNKGRNNITWVVTDSSGNQSMCTALFDIVDEVTARISKAYQVNAQQSAANTIYLGFANNTLRLVVNVGRSYEGFKYKWSTGDTTRFTRVRHNLPGKYEHWVEVTNSRGCRDTARTVITVVDNYCPNAIQDFVTIYFPQLLNESWMQSLLMQVTSSYACYNGKTICIPTSRLKEVTMDGAVLGKCNGMMKTPLEEIITSINPPGSDDFQVSAYPNPSSGEFYFIVKGTKGLSYSLHIVNSSGILLEAKYNIFQSRFSAGAALKKGVYYAEIRQGARRKMLRLLKIK